MKTYSILESALRLGGNNEEMITEANTNGMSKTKFLDYCKKNDIVTTSFMNGIEKCFDIFGFEKLFNEAKFKTIPGSSEGQSFTCLTNCGSFDFSIHDGTAIVFADQFDAVIARLVMSQKKIKFTVMDYGIREYKFY